MRLSCMKFGHLIVSLTILLHSDNALHINRPLTLVHSPTTGLKKTLQHHGGKIAHTSLHEFEDDGAGFIIATSAALGSFLQGYDTGVVGGALLFLIPEFQLTDRPLMQGLVVTMSTIGAVFGTLLASFLSESLGRRGTMRLASLVFTIASLLLLWSPIVEMLVLARLLMGIAIGASSSVVPVYIAECATNRRRGALATIPQLFVSSGIMLALITSFVISLTKSPSSWRMMMGLSLVPSFMLVGCSFMLLPESPRRLRGIKRGQSLPVGIGEELEAMSGELALDKDNTKGWGALTEPQIRRYVLVCMTLQMFQQLSGINAVVYFTPHTLKLASVPRLFRRFGLSQDSAALLASALAYAPKIPTLLLAMQLMDSSGRRALLLKFTPFMAVCLFALSAVFSNLSKLIAGEALGWVSPLVALGGLSLYGVFFSLSLGPIPNIVSSELFPSRCRSAAMTCSLSSQYFFNTLVGFAFPLLVHRFGSHVVFAGFGVMCLLAFGFVLNFLPETSGVGLDQMS